MNRFGATTTVVLLLGGCAAKSPDTGSFRSDQKAIYSNAVLQTERLAGSWVQVADFAATGAPQCAAGALAITEVATSRLSIEADLCLGGTKTQFVGEAQISGPGRITLAGADPLGLGAEWWVLWVDDGYRTLVIGTPTGTFGIILDRDADLPVDRLRAAREILDWNGYDLSSMRLFGSI